MSSRTTNPYRLLPAVEEILAQSDVEELVRRVGRELIVGYVQEVLDRWRAEIRSGELDGEGLRERLERSDLVRSLEARVRREQGCGLRRTINAAGVVLHTGLGRAPVHPEAAQAMQRAAESYCVLEVDRFTNQRNQRDDRLSELLCRLTGAEAGIVVNNNAAAVLLTLSTFAAGRETVVSRGELVEIGGSFRMPDVMERAGTKLVEVGTTNRTRAADFERAAGPDTGLFLKVHTSNFRVVGFTEELDARALAKVGTPLGVTTSFDLGSGLLEGEGATPLTVLEGEPLVRDAVAAGIDVVTFSGDKLLGGPQAGLIVGHADAIDAMRRNAMYRALRLDKVTIAGLERTLELVLEGRADEIPARAMLLARADELRPSADRIAAALDGLAPFHARVAEDGSQPGSGSAPGVSLPTWVVRLRCDGASTEDLAARLRAGEPPVFARIHEDELLVDPRTLLPGDEEDLLHAFAAVASSLSE